MYTLGIATYHVNSGAALLKDGELIACFEEDRLRRMKNQYFFPALSIKECLRFAGLNINDVSVVAVNHDPVKALSFDYLRHWNNPRLSRALFWRTFHFFLFYRRLKKDFEALFPSFGESLWPRVRFFEHHLCHAASSYYLSPFQSSALLTADGNGESATVLYAKAQGTVLKKIHEVCYPASLGKFYTAVTEYLGFAPNAGEGTVMALASYGDGSHAPGFDEIIRVEKNGRLFMDMGYFSYFYPNKKRCSERFYARFGQPRLAEEPLLERHKHIAAAAQKSLERNVVSMLEYLKDKVGGDNLCLAGGVFLNCALNSVVRKTRIFKNVFVQPAVNDIGTSFGAAYLWYYRNFNVQKPRRERLSPYFGREFADDEIKAVLDQQALEYEYCVDIEKRAAKLLADGKVVGWFQGRAEIGPRALGNRSFLASPSKVSMREHLNARIKNREWFRPFAPSILAEHSDEYFEEKISSPFMLYTASFINAKKKGVPACVHKDGTARPQTVTREDNPLFYGLISEFYKMTGIPMVLNTSFNLRGQPIVETPADAIAVFKSAPVDALIMGSYAVVRAERSGLWV